MPNVTIPTTSTTQTLTGDNGVTTVATFTANDLNAAFFGRSGVGLAGSAYDPAGESALDVDFSDAVEDVQFVLFDVDQATTTWDDQIRVEAYDPAGNPIPITFTTTSAGHVIEEDGSAGVLQIEGSNTTSDDQSIITVNIAGPVGSFRIFYEDGATTTNDSGVINLESLSFTNAIARDGTVTGTTGDDLIDGSYAGDPNGDVVDNNDAILPGDTGNDDLIFANAGNDSVLAGDGADEVYGGSGNDTIDGGIGDDTLFGDDGADTFIGSAGNDTNFGGTGDDTFDVADNSDGETITGGEDVGGGDIDTVDFSSPTSSAGVTVTFDGSESGTYAFDGTTASGSFAEIEQIDATAFNDTIDASANTSDVTILAGSGEDTITSGQGNDTIDLTATGGSTPDGADDVIVLADGFGTDTVLGFDAPTVDGSGNFTGNDTFDVSGLTDANAVPVNTHDVTVTDDGFGNAVLTFPNGESVTIDGISPAEADDPLYLNAIGIPLPPPDGIVTGTQGADVIDASYVSDLEGDRVDAGDELLAGEGPNDDIIVAQGGDDSIAAGVGNDEVFGGDGADTIDAGAGDDIVYGDTPSGAWFYEYYDLDPTGDPRNLAQAGFADGTADFEGTPTEVGYTDTISPVAYDAGDDYALKFTSVLTVTTAGDYSFTTASDDGSKLFINGVEVVNNDGHHGVVSVTGTPITLPAGDHVIEIIYYENDGGNALTASISGPDTGGSTTNLATYDGLRAATGDDVITGGAGNDTLFGGGDSDTFNIAANDDTDTITGGEDVDGLDVDTVSFDTVATTDGVNVAFTGDETGTYLVGGAGSDGTFTDIERIVGSDNNDVVDLSGDSTGITVESGAGDDTVTGGTGADTVSTGSGSDEVTFSNGDTVDTGANDDLLILDTTGPTSNGNITIDGGDEERDVFGNLIGDGDTLQLGDLADLSTLVTTTDPDGSFSGSVQLDDGSTLIFTDIERIICFTPGTTIATPQGARPIETLQVGDMVVTRDHGLQPIRWIQSRTVAAKGKFAPVRIRPGAVTGLEKDLIVSPQHRMLFTGYRAELLFGEREVLMPALHLVDDKLVTRETGGDVTYIHMMFDNHEVVYADGAASESFHPGEEGLHGITGAAREELFALFPELRSNPMGYGPAARRCLKKHETQMLQVR